eukprot:gene29020-11561_t
MPPPPPLPPPPATLQVHLPAPTGPTPPPGPSGASPQRTLRRPVGADADPRSFSDVVGPHVSPVPRPATRARHRDAPAPPPPLQTPPQRLLSASAVRRPGRSTHQDSGELLEERGDGWERAAGDDRAPPPPGWRPGWAPS